MTLTISLPSKSLPGLERGRRFLVAGRVGRTLRVLARLLIACPGALLALLASFDALQATEAHPSVAFLGVRFINDNEGYQPTTDAERARLSKVEELFKSALTESGRFSFVSVPNTMKARIDAGQPIGTCSGCEFDLGKSLGVDEVAWVTVQKVTNLIVNMTVVMADVRTQKITFAKAVDIRSNTDESWLRSMTYIVKNYLLAGSDTPQVAPAPIKLAVFDFEVEDFSAAAGLVGENPTVAEQLKVATSEARALLAQSGHYQIVDTSSADAEAVKAHSLRNCSGCDAGIALKLGAEQSLVGVVTKISMTEYNVTFQIRDARTGDVITNMQTGLRIGADYSWNRGAAWLIKNRLLAAREGAATDSGGR